MATLQPYHSSLLTLLDHQPGKGRGHQWLFRVALHLRHYHTEAACFRLLRACADEWHDRAVPDAEIWKAVRKAYSATGEEARAASAIPWPDPSPEAITRVLTDTEPRFTLEPLADLGASRLLPALFDWDELVCAGYGQWQGRTATLQEIHPHASAFQFVVPSPMTARAGVNQEGETAFRCLANTGPRRFLVVEGDSATKEEQARILTHLGRFLPLVLVVDSGGKSLHGWYWAEGQPEATARLFMEYAVHLGADPHTFVRCQWVRMPGGTRYADEAAPRPQPVLYAHPHILAEVSS
jgi:hypothetical protein